MEMANLNENLSDDTSDDDDIGQEMFQSEFDRSGSNDYAANRASLDLSDFESNRLSFTENDTPYSDQESMKEFSEFNDHNQAQSESNSEEESRLSFQQNPSKSGTETVQFHKYGHPTKIVRKAASVLYYPDTPPSTNSSQSGKRLLSCSDSEDQDETPARRTKFDDLARPVEQEAQNLEKAKAIMEKMGYKEGKGLGKHSQGRVAPVEMSKQRGRRGLGLILPGLEPADLVWDQSAEVVKVEEEATWLAGDHLPALPISTLLSWKEVGPRNHNIDNCTDFCDPLILTNIIGQKSIFDKLDGDEMRKARTRSNPFETIGKGIFLNRAAMKMANMDKVFGYMFTSPKTQEGLAMVGNDELLYFADVCAGPGGFSEYVLWRKKWRAKGFGFTLKGDSDFKLGDFLSGPCESFEPFYGVKEDGNVFDPANIESLMHFVMDNTGQQGVHFMMADGGFSVEGQENIQELLSKQLYLCQFLVALCIVRTGGHFVCKLFDLFSPFSVGLVYLMYRSFERISIHKPNTSRPANSERYIICKWKREDCEPTRGYLFDLNKELCQLEPNSKEDINLCVSMEEMTQDRAFFDYIKESNDDLGERQVVNLVKIVAFCRDLKLTEARQADLRRQCLAYWEVPDQARKEDKTSCEELAAKRLPKYSDINCFTTIYQSEGKYLKNVEQMEGAFKSMYDWHCCPLATEDEAHLFIGLGRNRVYRLAKGGKYWMKADITGLELSPGTIVYAEVVLEFKGVFKSQIKKNAFHIIDAISLGDEDVTNLHYTERLKMCKLYAESLYKSTRKDLCPLRIKVVYELPDLKLLFEGLTVFLMKNNTQCLLLKTDECAFQTKGVIFFKATKVPWMRHKSKSTNYCYYQKPGSDSYYDRHRPSEACAGFIDCFAQRLIWKWEEGVGIKKEASKPGVLHMKQILQFIEDRLPRR